MNFVAVGKVSWRNIKAISLQNGHFSQVPLNYRKKIKKEYEIKEISELDGIQADFLFVISMNSTEQVEIESKTYHRITDPFYEEALKISTALKIEIVKTASPSIEKWHNYFHKSLLIFPPLIQKVGYSSFFKYDSRFFMMFKKYVPSLNLSSAAQLEGIVNYEMHTRDYYIEIFKKLKPKVVCLYAFHYNAPLISAANDLGILTVDLQHGLQVGWNPLYNNYDELPIDGYQALPDMFAVWGQKEYENIISTFKSAKHRPIYMGSPWLRKIKIFKSSLPNEIINKLNTSKIKVLIILQNISRIPTLFLEIMEKSNNDILWIVRHHPKGERYTAKDFSTTKDILIDEEIDKVLFSELFQHVDIAISEGSALSSEASYFGVKNIITSPMGLENYAYEISKGFFYYLDNADKFDEILHQIQNEEQANVYNGYVDVETVDFLNELLEASEYKRERKIVISNTNLQDALELEISETAQKMYHEVKS
jgi:hypothetical protein